MDTPLTPPPAPNRPTRAVRLIVPILVLLLVGMLAYAVVLAKKHGDNKTTTSSAVADTHVYDERINSPTKTFDISVDEDKVVKGMAKITVQQNESVRVNIRAVGEEVRVELEGYGIITENDPSDNVPGGFSFVADKKGTFNYYALAEPEADGTISNERHLLGSIIVE